MPDSSMRTENDPVHHTRKMTERLQETIGHLRRDIDRVDEPKFKAMFETAAEVLTGLATAFRHYEQGSESAWRQSPAGPAARRGSAHGVTQDQRGQDQPTDKNTARR